MMTLCSAPFNGPSQDRYYFGNRAWHQTVVGWRFNQASP